jgi:hypothetical protein
MTFRCYFLSADGRIRDAEWIEEARTTAAAVEKARAMLHKRRDRPYLVSIEVWQGTSRVYPAGEHRRSPSNPKQIRLS